MNCPFCKTSNVPTVDSRPSKAKDVVARRRRYQCHRCLERFTTYEVDITLEEIRIISLLRKNKPHHRVELTTV